MQRVRWSDNICNEEMTCIHGFFTAKDLCWLWDLCPGGWATPTFYDEHVPGCGHNRDELLQRIDKAGLTDKERGYYFNFLLAEGERLIAALKATYPMVRGEHCH